MTVDPNQNSNDDRDAIAQFQVRRTRQIFVPILASLILIVLYGLFRVQWVAAIRSGYVIAGAVPILVPIALGIFTFWNWRCPQCGRMIQRDLNPAECMRCGARLR
jgi:hypothetical protein